MRSIVQFAAGATLLLFGLSFTLHATYWQPKIRRIVVGEESPFTMLLLLVVLGSVMIRTHNVWAADWRVLVTIVGWALLVKGGALLLAPGLLSSYGEWSESRMAAMLRWGGAAWIVGGAAITYFSLS